jgi:hypothetical protein
MRCESTQNKKTTDLFPNWGSSPHLDNQSTYQLLIQVETRLLGLQPGNDATREWAAQQAMTLAVSIGNTRWLLAQQGEQGIPKAFLVLVTFWLTLLFASFGLFAPRDLTAALVLTLCALAVSGAVEMILELEQPFGGLVQLSPQPMHRAVEALAR